MKRLEVERNALALTWSEVGMFHYTDLNAEAQARMDNTGMEGWRRHSLIAATDWTYEDLAAHAKARIDAALASTSPELVQEVSA